MRRTLLVLIAALLAIHAAWSLQDYFSIENLSLDATWHGTITSSASPGARLNSLVARVNLVPNGTYTTDPVSTLENGSLVFEWNSLEPSYDYTISSHVVTRTYGSLLHDQAYPTSEPASMNEYLRSTKLIDYNNASVRAFAASVANGETDTLQLAVLLADKVRRTIDYNLTTLNVDATYSASQVLARKQGVCDEITVLYIAALRSLGIPARYVTGYAYTNIFNPAGSWEGHSWAEAYISGQWVPFDLTYDEYIQLSPAHLPIRRSADATGSTINYTWYGRGVDMNARELTTNFTVTSVGPEARFGTLDASFAHPNTGPGWNELDVAVTNDLDSFVAPILEFSRTQGLTLPNTTSIIVPPHTTRIARIPVRITQQLRSRYRYTFPVAVEAHGFRQTQASFTAETNGPRYAKPDVPNESVPHPDLTISCTNVLGLPGANVSSRCSLANKGNWNLGLRVCADRCVPVTLLINEHANVTVPLTLENGTQQRRISVIGDTPTFTTITATGRAPAHVELSARANGRIVTVHVSSPIALRGNVTVKVGTVTLRGSLNRSSYEIPSSAFGLNAIAHVSATYDDVDGTHTVNADATVNQSITDYLRTRISNLLNGLSQYLGTSSSQS